MSESIKLNDNKYIDATGVYDSTLNQTQRQINSNLSNISSKSIFANAHYNFNMDSSYTISGLALPIDCGLLIISIRGTNVSSGGIAIFCVGYFFVKIADTYHNSFASISVSGASDGFSITFSGESANYDCSVLQLNWNFGSGSF